MGSSWRGRGGGRDGLGDGADGGEGGAGGAARRFFFLLPSSGEAVEGSRFFREAAFFDFLGFVAGAASVGSVPVAGALAFFSLGALASLGETVGKWVFQQAGLFGLVGGLGNVVACS